LLLGLRSERSLRRWICCEVESFGGGGAGDGGFSASAVRGDTAARKAAMSAMGWGGISSAPLAVYFSSTVARYLTGFPAPACFSRLRLRAAGPDKPQKAGAILRQLTDLRGNWMAEFFVAKSRQVRWPKYEGGVAGQRPALDALTQRRKETLNRDRKWREIGAGDCCSFPWSKTSRRVHQRVRTTVRFLSFFAPLRTPQGGIEKNLCVEIFRFSGRDAA
jgi:hypothetical protein